MVYIEDQNRITYFGETDYRNKKVRFGIKAKDRPKHLYVIGKTGMGKSTLLDNMAIQDIQNGEGFAFLDPHGTSAELLLEHIPEERLDDVLYFAPFDSQYPISFNVLEDVDFERRHLVVSGLMSVFESIWTDAWSDRMAYILQNTLMALLEYPDATLLGVNRMYVDKDFRKKVVDNLKDSSVRKFWEGEFAGYTDRFAAEATPSIQNKIGQFTANPVIRNIIAQPKTSFDVRKIMDERKILIVNLSKGQIGESNANLLGGMLVTKIYLAALSRADSIHRSDNGLPNFNLYVDEFQSFVNRSFADILAEARKYNLSLHIAHQYVEQMPDEVRAAVIGNVGTMITFRIGGADAEVFEKEFAPQFTAEDLVNLGKFQMYLKLMVDGVSSAPFSATTFPHIPPPRVSYRDVVVAHSRKTFAHSREEVEKHIQEWYDDGTKNEQKTKPNTKKGWESQKKEYKTISPTEEKLQKSMSSMERQEKKKTKPKKSKGPSKENMNELRDALKSVLGDALVEKKEIPPTEQQKQKEYTERKKDSEVSEDELKKILGE